ncbi:hypothetical protein V8D89_000398 [Ganoderma adspersum]
MDAFEKELSDAFAEMILAGGTSDGIPGAEPSAEPPSPVAPRQVVCNELEPEMGPSPKGTADLGEVTELLDGLRSTIVSGDLNQAMQPLDAIPVPPHYQLPTAALPDFSHNKPAADGSTALGLYDVKQHFSVQFKDIVDYAARAFRMLDTAQEFLEDPSRLSNPSPHIPDPSSSTPSAAFQDGASLLGSMMEKLSDSFGGNQMTKEMSRILQGNETYLRAGARELDQSLQSTPESSPYYPVVQSSFALVLLHLYELTHDSTDLDAAVDLASRGMAAVAQRNGFPPAATFLIRNWTYSQRLLSRREGSAEPLDRAIDIATTTLAASVECHPNDFAGRRLLAMDLAECLLDRHRHLGDVRDLDDALSRIHAAFKDDELEDIHSRYVLGSLHLERYARLALDDLDKALYLAIHLEHLDDQSPLGTTTALRTPHPDAAPAMHLLAVSFAERFAVVMDADELNKAVVYGRKAVEMCPPEHPCSAMYLSSLASLLHQRFVAEDDPADLGECVEKAQTALSAVSSGCSPFYPPQAVLGLALARGGWLKNDVEQIDEGIHYLTVARKNFSGGPHLESRIEEDFASALLLKFEHTKMKDDLDDAVRYAASALERAPVDDRSRAGLAFELGRMLSMRYSVSQPEIDLEHAVDILRSVANSTGLASTRLRAAMEWAKAVAGRGPAASLEAFKVALDILPLVAWSGHRMVVQYKTLISLSADIGPRAAACAISCGQLEDAVLCLERGRNVLWSQLLGFQGGARRHRALGEASGAPKTTTEADALALYIPHAIHGTRSGITQETREELKRRNPQLHGVLENLLSFANGLKSQAASLRPEHAEKMDGFRASLKSIYADTWLRNAARRWTSLRSTMEDLGRDSKEELHAFGQNSTLAELLTGGYVILLNAHTTRCDALIIKRAMDTSVQVDHVPLPELSTHIARQWAESIQIGMHDLQEGAIGVREIENIILVPILQELWRTTALPILTHLGISDTASPPARIWWCLSGPLAFLPLHAAGPYQAPGVPDLIVSSYTPTLRSLLSAYSYQAPRAAFSMLAIAQPDAPGMNPLPAVRKELSTIERACARVSGPLTTLVGPDATPIAASQALSSHTWLHITCHAHQDPHYPFDSAFHLHKAPLTLKSLMQLDLARVQFAFLSACLTSAGDTHLPDECIHLAAGLQFAGVRSAVATLWSVDDRAAAFVTDKVYGRLMKEGGSEPDAGEAARALHDAVLDRKAAGKAMVHWVPFIHVGI